MAITEILKKRGTRRAAWAGMAAVLALVLPFVLVNSPRFVVFGNTIPFGIDTLSYALVSGVVVLSLVLLVGHGGQLSLAAGFFMGVGAYLTMILNNGTALPFALCVVVSGLVCGLLGIAVGLPALRIEGTYLALVTITLASVLPSLVRLPAIAEHTGGSNGLSLKYAPSAPGFIGDVPTWLGHLPGIGPAFIGTFRLGSAQSVSVWTFYLVLAATIVMFWLVAGVLRGRTGRAMRAVRDHGIGAAASGVNVAWLKVMLFGLSGLVAGVAGGLYALVFRIVAPETFGLTLAIYLLFGMILGGHRALGGAVAGGFAVAYLPVITSQLLLPGGIASVALRRRRGRTDEPDHPASSPSPDPGTSEKPARDAEPDTVPPAPVGADVTLSHRRET
jgi:branched-chain amino acid transport system permease protein